MVCHSLLQGIFLTQGLNLGLLHFWQIFYCLTGKAPPPPPKLDSYEDSVINIYIKPLINIYSIKYIIIYYINIIFIFNH